jgi:hypothetical protein
VDELRLLEERLVAVSPAPLLMRSEPLAFCETSAIAAAASSLILSASTIVTRGIGTITGSPSSPFSVRVTSSLRQLTTLRMSEKPRSLSSRKTCSTVISARSAPARMISAMRA